MNRALAALVNGGLLGCLMTIAVWLTLRVIPRRLLNAATRYAVWWVTLATVAMLPLAYWPARGVEKRVNVISPQKRKDVTVNEPAATVRERSATPGHRSRTTAARPGEASEQSTQPSPPRQSELPGTRLSGAGASACQPILSTLAAPTPPERPLAQAQAFPLEVSTAGWIGWVFGAWAAVGFALVVRLCASWILLERTKGRAEDTDDGLRERACRMAGRRVRVAESAEISTPVAVGPWRTTILIPAGLFVDLDSEAMDQIIVHEASHLARYDDYALIAQRLLEAVLAWHPVVRWITRQIDLEREIACDDRVIAATGQARRYATCLTQIVELGGGVRASLAAATAADDSSHLARRIDMLLDKTRHTGTHLLKARLTVMVAVVCGLAWIAGRSPGFVAFATPLAQTLRQVPARVSQAARAVMLPRVVEDPQAPGARDFEGKVIEDSSGNPVASAEVRFKKAGMRELAADLDTDAQGRVTAPGLPAGDYTVDVVKPNYVGLSMKVKVPGEPLMVRMVRYAAISGAVTDQQGQAVPGTIRAPYGRTIGGARVAVLVKAEGSEQLKTARELFLDEGGTYRVYDLPPGQYAIGLWYEGLKDGAGVQLYPDSAHPRFFAVAGGEEYKNIDFRVAPQASYQVSGKVEIPKKGETYTLSLALAEHPAMSLAQVLTETDGSFKFDKVPIGSYDLLVAGPDTGYGARTSLLGPEPNFGRMPVQVGGGNVENLAISVSPGRPLSVTLKGAGSDALPPGCPQSVSVGVELVEPWGLIGLPSAQVAFGKEGTFKNLAPGRVRVIAGGLGAGCYQVNPPVVDMSRAPAGPVAVELASAGTIRGTLRGTLPAGSSKATDFTVVLIDAGASNDTQSQLAIPDAQGKFMFDGLRPGRYRMAAQAVGEAKGRWVADVTKMLEVEVAGGAPTDVDLPVKGGK